MAFIREEKDGQVLLKIEGAMTVYEVVSFRDELADCLKTNDGLILDLDDVKDCDTAGIQLLYSALKTAKDIGKAFTVAGFSNAVEAAMERVSGFGMGFFDSNVQ